MQELSVRDVHKMLMMAEELHFNRKPHHAVPDITFNLMWQEAIDDLSQHHFPECFPFRRDEIRKLLSLDELTHV